MGVVIPVAHIAIFYLSTVGILVVEASYLSIVYRGQRASWCLSSEWQRNSPRAFTCLVERTLPSW